MTVSYSSSGSFFKLLLRWKGSIWRSVWRELLVFLMLFYVVRIFYTEVIPWLDPQDKKQYRNQFNIIARLFNDYTRLIPLTFVLGFYVSNVVTRWWRQFECLAWPEDLLSIVCCVLPQHDEQSCQLRHQIARYINLSAALAWRDISSKVRLRFPDLQNIIDAGLLMNSERSLLQELKTDAPGIAWLAPLHWAQQLVVSEIGTGRVQTQFLSSFSNEMKNFRVSFRRLFSHDWVCLPLVYTQVAALATYSFFLFCLIGRQHLSDDDSIDFYVPIFTIVQFLFFVGWYKVGEDLMRPFGLDDDDFELNYILDRNVVTSFAIVNTLQSTPLPSFEVDSFWDFKENAVRIEGSSLVWGRVDLTRTAHKHPPKLHTYVDIEDDEEQTGCTRTRTDKFIYW